MLNEYEIYCFNYTDQEIDGEAFLELTDAEIAKLTDKLGIAKKICRILSAVSLLHCSVNFFLYKGLQCSQNEKFLPFQVVLCGCNILCLKHFVLPYQGKYTKAENTRYNSYLHKNKPASTHVHLDNPEFVVNRGLEK